MTDYHVIHETPRRRGGIMGSTMWDMRPRRDDPDPTVRVFGALLLLHALQAADHGLIAKFWTGNRETDFLQATKNRQRN